MRIGKDAFLFTFFGYLYESKGVEVLLAALARMIRGRQEDVRLAMVGGVLGGLETNEYVESLHRLAFKLGIADRLLWTGGFSWNSDEASCYLAASDACVFPFLGDDGVNCAHSSVAAAACHGVPILGSRGTFTESAFIDGQTALLCPPGRPDALAALLTAVLDNPDLRTRLGKGALALAEQHFSNRVAADRLDDVLAEASTRRRASAPRLLPF
jgi:glycosyltransferase involved in cell wall biosynthesis